MLHGDLGGVLDLLDRELHQLAHGGRRHGTGRADLRLTAAFGAGNGRVAPDEIADDAGHAQRVRHAQIGIMVFALQVHEYGRQNTAAAAGRRGDDGAVVRILLGCGKGVGADQLQLAHLRDLLRMLAVIQVFCLALHVQSARQNAGRLQSRFDLGAHGAPDLLQKRPDLRALVQFHILTQGDVAPLTVLGDLREGVFRIGLFGALRLAALDDDIAAADGFHAHASRLRAVLERGKVHGVRVPEIVRVLVGEDNLRRRGRQDLRQHAVRAVADAGQRQRAVERDLVPVRVRIFLLEDFCGALRPHGMRAGRAFSYFIQITNRFHDVFLRFLILKKSRNSFSITIAEKYAKNNLISCRNCCGPAPRATAPPRA